MPKLPTTKVCIKKAKIYHKDLSKDKVVGFAYSDPDYYIEIDPNQTNRQYFLTLVHELLHLLLPNLSEKNIVKIEETFGATLWVSIKRMKKKGKI
jgi:hypothetical protein